MLLSFELVKQERNGKMVFVPIAWKLYTLENLKVQVKHEFNAGNRELDRREFLLEEGIIRVEGDSE